MLIDEGDTVLVDPSGGVKSNFVVMVASSLLLPAAQTQIIIVNIVTNKIMSVSSLLFTRLPPLMLMLGQNLFLLLYLIQLFGLLRLHYLLQCLILKQVLLLLLRDR